MYVKTILLELRLTSMECEIGPWLRKNGTTSSPSRPITYVEARTFEWLPVTCYPALVGE